MELPSLAQANYDSFPRVGHILPKQYWGSVSKEGGQWLVTVSATSG